jgi:hypothetical protein
MTLRSLPVRPTRLGPALLLVAVGWFAPGRAAAECGDYVTIGGRPVAHAEGTIPGPLGPCPGPSCSPPPAPDPAPLSGGAPVPTAPDQSADWTAGRPAVGEPGTLFSFPPSAGWPSARPVPVFHPPRG